MKKFFASVFLPVIFVTFLPFICFAGDNQTITILYTGDILGQVTSFHG